MEYMDGKTLEKAWDGFDRDTKSQIAAELKGYIERLRSFPAPGYVGSVDRGPVTDLLLEWSTDCKSSVISIP